MKEKKKNLSRTKQNLEKQAVRLRESYRTIRMLNKELDANNKRLLKLDRLKSNFVSMVSHELRTPLAITKEGIRLLLDKVPGKINKKQQEILVAANTHIDRLTRIINNLLDISRIEAGKVDLKRDQVNIIELVRGTARTFEPQIKDKGLQLRLDLPCGRMEGYVDADKISQTLINLLSNAVKFTQKGYIEISLKESINEIECMVADSGEGISTENLSKLFDMQKPQKPWKKSLGKKCR